MQNVQHLLDRLPTLSVELRSDDAPPEGLQVRSLSLVEGLDLDHRAELTVSCHTEHDAEALLGADVALVFARGVETRRMLGIVDWLEDLGESNHLQFTRLRIVPAFTLLGLGRASRIWQHKSVRDILSELLEPGLQAYGRTFDFGSTTRGAQKRDYCVQYRESDRRFAQRLLEEEGLAFTYLHEGTVEQLVLRDANEQYAKFANLDGTQEIPFIDHDADQATVESVQVLGHRRELTVTSVARRDYDWKNPRDLLDHEDAGSDERSRARRVYLHERRRYIHDDQPNQVGDELAAMQRSGDTLEGRSNVSGLQAGQRFVLVDAGQNDGEYLVTRITHELRDDQSGGTYFNRFSCIPLARTHRPRVSVAKPRVHGPHTATVVGDDEIHTDEHGRIEVQFHWEEGPKYAAHSSCWMRCAQSWSSGGWGAQFIPRVGMEVVVEFLEGNPDRPLVTGCVYNGDNRFPFAVPANKTQSGWRTRSSPDSEGYNMLRFEDATGREEIFIHGQKDWNIVIEHDKGQEVRHDETLHVFHDRTKTVDNNEHETIHKHRTIVVGLTHTETIGVNMALTVGVNEVETVGVAKTVTVGQFLTTTVGKDMSTTVVENLSEGVGESKSSTVGVDKTVSVGSNYRIDVGEEFSIVCGDSSIVMKKDGTITIRGKTIDSETTSETNLRGKPIKLNCS